MNFILLPKSVRFNEFIKRKAYNAGSDIIKKLNTKADTKVGGDDVPRRYRYFI